MKRQPTEVEVIQAKKRASSLIQHQNKLREIGIEEAQEKRIADEKREEERINTMQVCERAKRQILVYSGRGVIYTTGQDGKRNYKSYSDEQKNQKIAEFENIVKKTCGEK